MVFFFQKKVYEDFELIGIEECYKLQDIFLKTELSLYRLNFYQFINFCSFLSTFGKVVLFMEKEYSISLSVKKISNVRPRSKFFKSARIYSLQRKPFFRTFHCLNVFSVHRLILIFIQFMNFHFGYFLLSIFNSKNDLSLPCSTLPDYLLFSD